MAYFYLFLAALSLLYYVIIVIYVDFSVSFSWLWLLSALFFGGLCVCRFMEKCGKIHIPGGITIAVRLALAAFFLFFLITETRIVSKAVVSPQKQADYLIVLGAKVKGKKPSNMLSYRLKAALAYLEENPDTVVIVSGGQGADEEISEAECMADYLIEHGIESSRIRLEDTSTTTQENLRNSRAYLDSPDCTVLICSNGFHIYRSLKFAEKEGYTHAFGLAAKSNPVLAPHFYVREFFAVTVQR